MRSTRYKKISLLIIITFLTGCATPSTYTKFVPDTSWENFKTEIVVLNGLQIPVFAYTKSDKAPTVVVAHGCDGLKGGSYNDWARMMTLWGYNAVLIDSYAARGYPVGICDRASMVIPSERAEDLADLAWWIKQQSWHKGGIAVIGFSAGGSTTLNIASNRDIASRFVATVSYYPACGSNPQRTYPGRDFSVPLIPSLIHFGGSDDWTPPDLCYPYVQKYEHYTYPNATHGWDIPGPARNLKNVSGPYGRPIDTVMRYNKIADQTARQRTRDFLDKALGTNSVPTK